MLAGFDKKRVGASFDRAAVSYDEFASLQRRVADTLVDGLDAAAAPRRILDIGSGTGYCAGKLREKFPDAEIVCLDLSFGMLVRAREKAPRADLSQVCGDAETLPFSSGRFDLVISNLAIQWCGNHPRLFDEMRRVACPGGTCHVSTFGPDTLRELRLAWSRIDARVHVNRFAGPPDLLVAAAGAGFSRRRLQEEIITRRYRDIHHLGRELKSLGAGNLNPGRSKGLTGKASLEKLQRAFHCDSAGGGVPVTWHMIYLSLGV